ncbi:MULTISPECIES: hypothetical protein [Halomonadaceae]|uniref:hypothetical protein n=1 Tax=Halomonadaceae TaxID=28256 RepID=UPI00159AB01C|nr:MULTISPECIES: hypothetical protein [Halomonas]QJQ95223.1 hypothetical protein HIO72_08035 [Halomonas sp. PA5]
MEQRAESRSGHDSLPMALNSRPRPCTPATGGDDGSPIHSMAEKFMPLIEEEAAELLHTVQQRNGSLS